MSKSSLSSVVSNLVRASMGSSISNNIADEDLDRHVAELILKEAKQKGDRYNTDGIRAYLNNGMSDSNVPKTNKRFLSSIIRNTDDHNKTILRAQALAAQEVKREREEQERKERRARAEEAVAAEQTRRLMGVSRSDSDRWDRRDSERKKRKERCWETWDDEEDEEDFTKESRHESDRRRRRHRHRSQSNERGEQREEDRRSSRRSHGEDRVSSRHRRDRRSGGDESDDHYRHRHRRHSSHDHDSSHRRRRHRSRSASRHKSRKRSETLAEPDGDAAEGGSHKLSSSTPSDDREAELRRKLKAKYRAGDDVEQKTPHSRSRSRGRSPTPGPHPNKRRRISLEPPSSPTRTARSLSSMSRSPSPPSRSHSHTSQLPSKMDKYFEESYDPRLDVAPLPTAPKVPSTGLIDNTEFEGWDAMLELIRIRREDKEDKKRLERMGIGKEKKSGKGKELDVGSFNGGWRGGTENIMEIEYKKRGSVREWDMGKEGFE